LYVDAFCPYTTELAVIITRARDGAMAAYPVVETVQGNHICHVVRAPANVPAAIAGEASRQARLAIAAIDGIGSFGVEMFLTAAGEVLINELAPRVHNSGHYTIEACECSQFENHVRAVLGWPLGSTAMVAPAAVMINLLGSSAGPGTPQGLESALAIPGAHVHIYGKAKSGVGRKMGHITALGQTVSAAEGVAQAAASAIQFGTKS
jgi:5-(carboxyamino)imidazole ribonucleotide synthase